VNVACRFRAAIISANRSSKRASRLREPRTAGGLPEDRRIAARAHARWPAKSYGRDGRAGNNGTNLPSRTEARLPRDRLPRFVRAICPRTDGNKKNPASFIAIVNGREIVDSSVDRTAWAARLLPMIDGEPTRR